MITYDNNDDDDDDDDDNDKNKIIIIIIIIIMIMRVIFNEGTKLAMAVFSGYLSYHTI